MYCSREYQPTTTSNDILSHYQQGSNETKIKYPIGYSIILILDSYMVNNYHVSYNDTTISYISAMRPYQEIKYKPWFFNEPECLSSDKENIPPTESITPPSLKNLSLEEGTNGNENEATSWEASVARNIMTLPRASWPSTLEDLGPDTDNDIIDITDFSERLTNDRRSPQHKQKFMTPTATQGHCPTPQNSPTYLVMNAAAATPAKPHRTEIQRILLDKRSIPHGWPTCLKKQPPRVAFKNNDIYMINYKESDTYEEPKERNLRVMYKLKVSEDPASKNMPHEE